MRRIVAGVGLALVLVGSGGAARAMSRGQYLRRLRRSNPRKYRQLMNRYGSRGSGGGSSTAKAPPPLKWNSLEAGLASAKSASKPLVVVFATETLKSAATFNRAKTPQQIVEMRKALTECGAVPVRLLPPKFPNTTGMNADEVKAAREAHKGAVKKYQEAARKYGAQMYPTMVFLDPDGDVMGKLFCPDAHTVYRALKELPAAVKTHQEKKAKAAAAKAAADAAKAGTAAKS